MIDPILKEAALATLDTRHGAAIEDVTHELLYPRGFALTKRETLAVLQELVADGLAEQRNGEWWRVAVKAVGEVQAELF